MKKILGILLVVLSVSSVFAQKEYKFGHINSNELMSVMPEKESISLEFQKYQQMLSEEYQAMMTEFQSQASVFNEKKATYSDTYIKTKEEELLGMQQRIQGFQQTAQQDLQQKEAELFQPMMDKAQAAIEAVSKANGFTYIFDLGAGGVIYFSDDSIDILPLVKKELGIE
jgi:outer membrane protein